MSLEESIARLDQSVQTLTQILSAAVNVLHADANAAAKSQPLTISASPPPPPAPAPTLQAAVQTAQLGPLPAPHPGFPGTTAQLQQAASAAGFPQMQLPGMAPPGFPGAPPAAPAALGSAPTPTAFPQATYDDVKAALTQLSGTPGRTMQTITDLLSRYGVTSATQLKAEAYAPLVAQARELVANPGLQP